MISPRAISNCAAFALFLVVPFLSSPGGDASEQEQQPAMQAFIVGLNKSALIDLPTGAVYPSGISASSMSMTGMSSLIG